MEPESNAAPLRRDFYKTFYEDRTLLPGSFNIRKVASKVSYC